MAVRWVSMAEACYILDVSRRTIQRRIQRGEIESKLENGRRFVAVPSDQQGDINISQLVLIEQLLSEVQHLRQRVTDLQDELNRKDTQAKRQKWASFWHR
jgi:polyhydroxyalkanoate synthesis regulator phasin